MVGSRRLAPGSLREGPWGDGLAAHDAGHAHGRLERTLAHICDRHLEAVAKDPGGSGDPLRPHSKIAIMPTGEYCAYAPRGRPDQYAIPLCMRAFPAPPARGAVSSVGGQGRPCALRLRSLDLPRLLEVAAMLFRKPCLTLRDRYHIRAGKVTLPRDVLGAGRMGLASRVLRIVREDECRMCLGALERLEPVGRLPAGKPPGLSSLLELFESANVGRPPESPLGTVLLAPGSLERLGGGEGGASGGWEVRAHDSVPAGAAYAVASAGGPALVRGPTVIDCESDEFSVRHYCLADDGSGGARVELPWGGRDG